MTRKAIKKRRWFHSLGPDKVIRIEKTKVKHELVFFTPEIYLFTYWERLKSLFKFREFSLPEYFNFKGRKCQVSKYRLSVFT
jgi:hypothetical protein